MRSPGDAGERAGEAARAGAAPDRRLSLRLLLAAAAAFVVLVPFALVLLAVELRWPPLERLDVGLVRWMHDVAVRHEAMTSFFIWVRTWMHDNVFRAIVAVLVVVLWVKGARRLALWAAVTMTVSGLLGFVIKLVVGRVRPVLDDPVDSAPGYSFPSGHSLNSFVGVGILLVVLVPLLPRVWRVVAWVVGALVVLLVGYDRVALSVHYLSDVVGAWLVGLAVLLATSAAFETWRRGEGRAPRGPVEAVTDESREQLGDVRR